MTDHHDQLKVAPDPARAEELRLRLHARLAGVMGVADLESARPDPAERVAPQPEISIPAISTPHRPTHRRWLAAAAAVVAIGAASVAISVRDSGDAGLSTTPTVTPLPGEEIRVSADAIELGTGLVGEVDQVARADGRTYVIAGRYQSEQEAVLGAFDDGGRELWRIELDGEPRAIEALDGDLWVVRGDGVTQIDASDGRVLGEIAVHAMDIVAAFDSLWVLEQLGSPFRVIRVDPDLSTTTIDIPRAPGDREPFITDVVAGAGAIWVPMRGSGVAMIDPGTLDLTMIPASIGHEPNRVAIDGDVAYAASRYQVTSIVDGRAHATVALAPGDIQYMGRVDGVFGVQLPGGRFRVLQADDPMVVEDRQLSPDAIAGEIAGDAWVESGGKHSLRRVEFVPVDR
jgi:hypothetical protein